MRGALSLLAVALIAGSAQAQESWEGPYVGIGAGGLWGDVTVRDNPKDGVAPGPFDYDISGLNAGMIAGYNWMQGSLLVGIEGNVGYASINGAGVIDSEESPAAWQDLSLGSGVLADVTGRLGFTFDNVLIYGKAGVAVFTGSAIQDTTKVEYHSEGTGSFVGWTVGAGVETFVADNVSVGAEYQYYNFGEQEAYQQAIDADPPYSYLGAKFLNWHDVNFGTIKVTAKLHF
jgi:outer membrane immunogenic protein